MISASFVDPTSQAKIANSAIYGQFVKSLNRESFLSAIALLRLLLSAVFNVGCNSFSRKPVFHVLQIVEVLRLQ